MSKLAVQPEPQEISADRFEVPFLHFYIPHIFDAQAASVLREWAENSQDWHLRETSFYSQYSKEIYIGRTRRAADLVLPIDLQEYATGYAERIFSLRFRRDRFEAHAHRFEPGQGIGIHNDRPIGGTESHRIVVHLNCDFHDSHGGHLIMYSSEHLEDIGAVYRPIANTAIAFPLGQNSWHSVANVLTGRRHSIVFSFWAAQLNGSQINNEGWRRNCDMLERAGAKQIEHTGRSLLEHLVGVANVLDFWECDGATIDAGLFHSVYGTTSFRPSGLCGIDRTVLQSVLGHQAERLVHSFSRSSLSGLSQEQASEDVIALIHIHWANICEQARYELIGDDEVDALLQSFAATRPVLRERAALAVAELLGLPPGAGI